MIMNRKQKLTGYLTTVFLIIVMALPVFYQMIFLEDKDPKFIKETPDQQIHSPKDTLDPDFTLKDESTVKESEITKVDTSIVSTDTGVVGRSRDTIQQPNRKESEEKRPRVIRRRKKPNSIDEDKINIETGFIADVVGEQKLVEGNIITMMKGSGELIYPIVGVDTLSNSAYLYLKQDDLSFISENISLPSIEKDGIAQKILGTTSVAVLGNKQKIRFELN